MRDMFRLSLASALVASLVATAAVAISDQKQPDTSAQIMAAGDPVAIITPMPDYVSNGTWVTLYGNTSYDPDGGVLVDYKWEIILGTDVTTFHAMAQTYKFTTLGLYKITLTVTDNESKTGQAFTALVSVLDSDQDNLPDWWEMKYFLSLDQTASGDPDGDGYTNIEEYAGGTNPTVKDPQLTLLHILAENWLYLVIIAAVIVGGVAAAIPFLRRRRKRREKQKIDAAIAIEKALEEEGK